MLNYMFCRSNEIYYSIYVGVDERLGVCVIVFLGKEVVIV